MVRSDDLLSGLLRYGRGQTQNFVVRDMTISDAVMYLRVELCLEMAQVMSFRTVDSSSFERTEDFTFTPGRALHQSHESTLQDEIEY